MAHRLLKGEEGAGLGLERDWGVVREDLERGCSRLGRGSVKKWLGEGVMGGWRGFGAGIEEMGAKKGRWGWLGAGF